VGVGGRKLGRGWHLICFSDSGAVECVERKWNGNGGWKYTLELCSAGVNGVYAMN